MYFTKEELYTLVSAIESETAKVSKYLLEQGRKPSDNKHIERLNTISRKAYQELSQR